jgi:membrane protease YdiL (CAAX protease family)
VPRGWLGFSYYRAGGWLWLLFVTYSVIVSPLAEEWLRRGFLYPVFRDAYGRLAGVTLTLGVGVYFHWGILVRSVPLLVCFILFETFVCLAREHTKSLWPCILCHCMYNCVQLLPWPIYVTCVLLLLPVTLHGKTSIGSLTE